MKYFITISLLAALLSPGMTQERIGISSQPEYRLLEPAGANWQEFDRQGGRMQFQAGANYTGGTIGYLHGGSAGIIYSLAIDVLPVAEPANQLQGAYNPALRYASFLVPFWFSIKFRLTHNNTAKISPYIITGMGPTLGIRLNPNRSFLNSFSNIETAWGGGGFAGAGFDYLWAEEWALSFDIRYNVIYLNSPIGSQDNYSGFSFAIGFMRAFGF